MFFSVIIFIVVAKTFYCKSDSDYPSCGSCWCIPSDSGLGPCPLWQPQSNFSSAVIETYQKQIPSWIYRLNCNPYDDASCTTTPRQTMLDSEEAVCGYVYPVTSANPLEVSCTDYTMITFASRVEAERNKAVVTHEGSCGLCSTAQDLAVYLTEDFTQAGKICATKGIFNESAGLQCYMELGLTEECSKIWNYDGIFDGAMCGKTCMGDITAPNNGPPPECALSDCLQCDEEQAGPIFSSFGGRTRRRSGLQSEIIRDCASVARIYEHNPCINSACGC